MPEISRFYGIIVKMYFSDHNPPHFHAEYGSDKAEYTIETLEVIVGKLPKRAHSLVLEWAAEHRSELRQNWQKAIVPSALDKIKPLD